MGAIYAWIQDRSEDENWVAKFLPKDDGRLQRKYEQQVKLLNEAGFQFSTIEAHEEQVRQLIYSNTPNLNMRQENQKESVTNLLKKIEELAIKIAEYKED